MTPKAATNNNNINNNKIKRERDSHTINCVHENQKQLGGNINRHA